MMKPFISAVFGAALAFGSALQAETITVTTGEYAPFTGEALPEGGLVNGLVTRIAAKAGIEVEYEYMPWKRALEITRQGKKAASSYWSPREDTTGLTIVGPVSVGETVLFFRKDKPIPDFQSPYEVEGITIGATLGYGYYPEFWARGESGDYTIQTAKDDISNFRKLAAGRIDAFIIDASVGWTMINENFSAEERANFAALSTPLVISEGYLQVSTEAEGGQALADRLQAAYDEMKASGELDAANSELNELMGIGNS